MSDNGHGKSKRPDDTPFKQQRIQAWQPVLTPKWVIASFVVVGLAFIPIGAWLNVESDNVVEHSIQYDGGGADVTDCAISTRDQRLPCQLTFNIDEEMKAPIYVHYELENFYQNHRRYVKSLSTSQLTGTVLSSSELSDCSPLETNNSQALSPCGLVANSMFNDIFTVAEAPSPYDGTSGTYMQENLITWYHDRHERFSQPDGFTYKQCDNTTSCTDCLGSDAYSTCQTYTSGDGQSYKYWYPNDDTTQYLYETYPEVVSPLEGVQNEHFINWMRTAALPKFRKLYGRIESDIPAGSTIVFNVTANYYVSDFGGKKSLVLSTAAPFGGKNQFLGLAYLIAGAICMGIAGVFIVKQLVSPRKLGDTRLLQPQGSTIQHGH